MNLIMLLILLLVLSFLVVYYLNRTRPGIGIFDGKLLSCSSRPNCVSSFSKDKSHFILPLPYVDMNSLKKLVLSIPRAKIIKQEEYYLYVEFRSKIFSFVDDTEFLIDEGKKQIDTRSGARVGYSDQGVNRSRLEMIRKKIEELSNRAD